MTTMTASTISPKAMTRIMNITRFALGAAFVLSAIATLHPDLRIQVRDTVMTDFRKVVSTAQGDLTGSGLPLTVAKIKTRDGLMLEVYESQTDGGQRLVERIEMPNVKDGYFNFNGSATNLAIEDIDGDGRPEIIAPTFDQNLVGHLNVYRYDSGANAFMQSMR